jgi:phosphinothricin acetyltransferase
VESTIWPVLRHADPRRDGAACAAIYAPFVADTPVSFEEVPPDADEMARRIATGSERFPWLVAEDRSRAAPVEGGGIVGEKDGIVVGFAYASAHRERAGYRWAADVAVYIGEGFRGRGVGRALYRALFDLLRRQGIQVACAGITLPNDASVALHEACGFELVGIYRRIGWKAGQWRDVGWWELELVPRGADAPAEPRLPVLLGELWRIG